ncbi:MAG: hypothetical protein IPP33_14790, partial [Flavobacteriales bacterium]|nr:hypothetical protein [Flavobacteriales bacterium]
LEMAFGTGGTFRSFTGAGGTQCSAIAIDAGGKILIGGSAATSSNFRQSYVCRLLPSNGQLDSGFGTNGELFHGLSGSTEDTPALAVQSDGKLLLAGTAYDFPSSDLLLLRYLETPITGIESTVDQIRSVHADATGANVFGTFSANVVYELSDAPGRLITTGQLSDRLKDPNGSTFTRRW